MKLEENENKDRRGQKPGASDGKRFDASISYAHEDDEHDGRIRRIHDLLETGYGLRVCFDRDTLCGGTDIREFMKTCILDSRFIICACTERYVEKFDSDDGSGVSTEGTLIKGLLADGDDMRDRVCPLLFDGVRPEDLPPALRDKYCLDFSDDARFDENMDALFETVARAVFPPDESPLRVLTGHCGKTEEINGRSFFSPEKEMTDVSFPYVRGNGKYRVGKGDYMFETGWMPILGAEGLAVSYTDGPDCLIGVRGAPEGDADGHDGFAYPALEEMARYGFVDEPALVHTGETVIYVNNNGHLAAVRLDGVGKCHPGAETVITFSYHIYGQAEEALCLLSARNTDSKPG